MYDAIGVRRHAGMQAEVLNLIVEDLFQGHPISEKRLKELLGPTLLQVGAGAIVGILAGYLCCRGYSILLATEFNFWREGINSSGKAVHLNDLLICYSDYGLSSIYVPCFKDDSVDDDGARVSVELIV
ncbi:hypothetical protein KP509_33G061500 [Ceratopteris richardii]|uniref:Uncharacterized protein n=1 Tax=Ceratopteris richardii TaxID=49495 RepID=A0A8T2QQE3_CERRI|nr:hypothetical protein KP509_33G061500 [Ceratopteris richardii]